MGERASREGQGDPKDTLRRVPGLVSDEDDHKLIHERLRLGIVSALAVNEALSFREMKDLLGATDGNLSVHARKLEDGGLVKCTKQFVKRSPKTVYRITPKGRKTLQSYLEHMESLIRAVKEG